MARQKMRYRGRDFTRLENYIKTFRYVPDFSLGVSGEVVETPSNTPSPLHWLNIGPRMKIDKKVPTSAYTFHELLLSAKVFEVDNTLSSLLEMTDNKIRPVKLPFPVTFIDARLGTPVPDYGDVEVYGMLCCQHKEGGDVVVLYSDRLSNPNSRNKKLNKSILALESSSGEIMVGFGLFNLLEADKPVRERIKELAGEENAMPELGHLEYRLGVYLLNFLDILQNPGVEMVEVTRSEKTNKKRKRKGKMALPPSTLVRVTGTLKQYIKELKSGKQFTYSHRFWVRGHWRYLRSEKFSHKRGMRIWIPPFVKGSGVLIDKNYLLEDDKQEEI